MTNASTDQFAIQNKQININKLKSQIEYYEKEKAAKMADLANNNTQLTELKNKLNEMVEKTNDLAKLYDAKRSEAQEFRDTYNPVVEDPWRQEVPTNVPTNETPSRVPNVNASKVRYRCLYAFHARNADELTIEPGDVVMVFIL